VQVRRCGVAEAGVRFHLGHAVEKRTQGDDFVQVVENGVSLRLDVSMQPQIDDVEILVMAQRIADQDGIEFEPTHALGQGRRGGSGGRSRFKMEQRLERLAFLEGGHLARTIRGGDHQLQFVGRGQQVTDDRRSGIHATVAHERHDALHHMGEVRDRRESEKARRALDAVGGAENPVQTLRVARVVLQLQQVRLEGLEMFSGLLNEEAQHFMIFGAHEATRAGRPKRLARLR
jgi:hypothetical protein